METLAFGDFNNARRFAREIELVGAGGIYVVDKRLPKMNSFRSHTHLLANPMEVFKRIRAIEHHVREADFVVVARTEAMVCGFELEVALERCNCYRLADADAILVHLKRRDADEVKAFTQAWRQPCPTIIVPTTYASTQISSSDGRLPDRPEG
ncbi:isocitrate lyase/phosphoenolpyruvate mutase family protein, partial [Bradyrhizobium sp. SRL28]|uniref:isocitrate lyase/phosphoenolpyruvate mutase family protein n=1 Tax=Bradyrhizobium sp. SRL28 TaxID=2836178 RepID=UPI001BDF293A